MIFNIQHVLSKGAVFSLHEELNTDELFKEDPTVLSASPLRVQLEVRPEGQSVRVIGQLAIDVEMPCSRCLTPVKEQLAIPFEEVFVPKSVLSGSENEENIIVVEDERVDLVPYVQECALVSLSAAPLCSEECKGLCLDCGQNLNEQSCQCKQEYVNPKFAALKDLFNN